jgi:hypothetical protein
VLIQKIFHQCAFFFGAGDRDAEFIFREKTDEFLKIESIKKAATTL